MSFLTAILAAAIVAAPAYPPELAGLPHQDVQILGKAHRLYWTFDDHPVLSTPRTLAVLRKYKIKGTFFVVGYPLYAYYRTPFYGPAKHRFNSVQQMVKDGHVLGNHSVTHRYLCKGMKRHKVHWEIRYTQQLVKRATGITLKYWRPPHGHRCKYTYRYARKYKLKTVMWDVDDMKRPMRRIIRDVLNRVRSGYTHTILLFHMNPSKLEKFILRLRQYRNAPRRAKTH